MSDGQTPVLATTKQLFFYQGQIARSKCPSCLLAAEITAFAHARKPPYFVHLWGGIEPGLLPLANDSPVPSSGESVTVSKNFENDVFGFDFTYVLISAQLHGYSHLFLGVGRTLEPSGGDTGSLGGGV